MANYPYSCNPADVIACQQKMDEGYYYCGDGQVRGEYPHFAQRIWDKYGVKLNVAEGDLEDLASGTVDFYSFSYYMSNVVSTDPVLASTGEMGKRYGFVYVDADDKGNGTFDRSRKDSFFWYKNVIESNGEDLA